MNNREKIAPEDLSPYPHGARDLDSHPHDETPPRVVVVVAQPVVTTAPADIPAGAEEGTI